MSYELGNAVARVVAEHTGLEEGSIVGLHITGDLVWVVYGVRTGPGPEDIQRRTRALDPVTGATVSDDFGEMT
jgi:hypothetical protein